MGITKISATITNLVGDKQVDGEFIVDTGAAYTVVPPNMVKKLNLKPERRQGFTLADGTTVNRKLGSAIVKIDERRAPTTVVLGEKGDSPLIGIVTLGGMGLMVDPFKRQLRPMKLMLA